MMFVIFDRRVCPSSESSGELLDHCLFWQAVGTVILEMLHLKGLCLAADLGGDLDYRFNASISSISLLLIYWSSFIYECNILD